MTTKSFPKLTIFGAGAFGTALAQTFQSLGFSCCLWGRNHDLMKTVSQKHENEAYLPGVPLSPQLKITSDLSEAIQHSHHWIIAIKANAVPSLVKGHLAAHISPQHRLIIAAKGFDQGSDALLHQALHPDLSKTQILALTGPSFAAELARKKPTALVLAGEETESVVHLAACMTGDYLRVYPSHDLTGALFGGAFKNILAIGAGIVRGAELGENARAALVCRGFHEMVQLATKMGADQTTLFGLSGLGDLCLTAMSESLSRNKKFGMLLGQGLTTAQAKEALNTTIEGASSARIALNIAQKYGVDMPITHQVHDIIEGLTTLDDVIKKLMERPLPAAEWPSSLPEGSVP